MSIFNDLRKKDRLFSKKAKEHRAKKVETPKIIKDGTIDLKNSKKQEIIKPITKTMEESAFVTPIPNTEINSYSYDLDNEILL